MPPPIRLNDRGRRILRAAVFLVPLLCCSSAALTSLELAAALELTPTGPPNRRPAATLTLAVADAEAAEALAQRAAAVVRTTAWEILAYQTDVLSDGSYRLTMNFGPPGGSARLRLLIDWAPPRWSGPRLAIIIDDCGARDPRTAGYLELPVTPSVLPYREFSAAVVPAARDAGRRVLLHLPCQPLGAEYPGPGALYVDQSDDELRRLIAAALNDVGAVDGVNNHMGSRLTADRRAVSLVLTELDARGLYFVDSYTHHGSVVGRVAAELGLSCARRDVFLDNSNRAGAIEAQLRRALELAVERDGPVVAIGHDRPTTLDVIRRLLPLAAELGVALVPPSACLTLDPAGAAP